MLKKQIEELSRIIKNEDLKKYAGDAFWNLIYSVVTTDWHSGVMAVNDIKKLIFHMPTILFWDKMKQFLLGTFHSYEDQVKLSARFYQDEKKYTEFVKKQIYLIDEIDDDAKIDYYAKLTRCFLLTELESNLYFKLAKIISLCTVDELKFLQEIPMSYRARNTAMISSLYFYGLFSQEDKGDVGGVFYYLSDFCKALKQNSLNYEDSFNGAKRRVSYEQIAPLGIPEPVAFEEIANAFEEESIILDGGKA